MRTFQCLLFVLKRSRICYYITYMTVTLRILWRLIFKRNALFYTILHYLFMLSFYFIFVLCFQWMFFNSVKEINRLRKEIYKLLSKRMSNTYFKVGIEEKWGTQIFDFPILKISLPDQFLRSSNSRKYHWILGV